MPSDKAVGSGRGYPRSGNGLSKAERLCGHRAVSNLMSKGQWGSTAHLRFRWIRSNAALNRMMVVVPKRLFKRAVRRNLLKRRLREAYRLQKGLLRVSGIDFMLLYASREVLPYSVIAEEVAKALDRISEAAQAFGGSPEAARAFGGSPEAARAFGGVSEAGDGSARALPREISETDECKAAGNISKTAGAKPSGQTEEAVSDGDEQ